MAQSPFKLVNHMLAVGQMSKLEYLEEVAYENCRDTGKLQ